MAFVDRERFKRFEQFLAKHIRVFADAAGHGYSRKGPGVLIYNAPDDRFDPPTGPFRFDYKSKSEIDTLHQAARDEMLQGMLDRYKPPAEAVFLAIYPDNTYDISRVVITVTPSGTGAAPATGAPSGPVSGSATGGETPLPN